MTKELEALEELHCELRECCKDNDKYVALCEKTNLIETALKNYQKLIEKPYVIVTRTRGYAQAIIDTICKNFKEIKITNLEDQKKLKALEIINNKDIDIWLLKVCDYDNYCRIRTKCLETNVGSMVDCDKPAIPLPIKEEFDFLKEVLL